MINDGSSDTEALEQVLERYPDNLLYIEQENQGAAAAQYRTTRRHGRVCCFPRRRRQIAGFLEKQIELLKSNNADIVFADADLLVIRRLMGARSCK